MVTRYWNIRNTRQSLLHQDSIVFINNENIHRRPSEMSKIESLTQQQQSRLSIIQDKWIAIGLSTDRVDRGTAERALHAAYKSAGKSQPRFLIMLRSPLEACLAVALIRSGSAQVRAQVSNQVSNQV